MFKLGKDPSRLVSDSLLAEPSSTSCGVGGASDASTEQQQREAAAALTDHDNGDIFAWLKLARSAHSIEPIPEQRSRNACISSSQIRALFVLKDCPDNKILSWLELARVHRNDTAVVAFERGPSLNSGRGNNLSSLLETSEPSSSGAKLWENPAGKGYSQSVLGPLGQQYATEEFSGHHPGGSVNMTRSKNAKNHYWCTVCEELKSYKDGGTWKKHEKEHETIFVCEMDHAAESKRTGQSQAPKLFTCKRRDLMVNHLSKAHGISETYEGRNLADQWRHTVEKQAWSCGFCISVFSTFQDRLKHVDSKHFRRRQHIREWDLNKVVLGLLQQPKMERAWKTKTASLPPWVQPESLAWDEATAKNLHAMLEIGPSDDHHASTLADEAYYALKPNEGPAIQSGTTHANHPWDAAGQATLSSQDHYHATSALMSNSGLYHRPAVPDFTIHPVSNGFLSARAPTSNFAFEETVEPMMPSFDLDGHVGHNASLFSSSQSWTSAPEMETFSSGHGQSSSYGGGGAEWPTSGWYDH